jgi:hypothetical protein
MPKEFPGAEIRKGSKGIKNPSEPSYGHLLEKPSHHNLQKVGVRKNVGYRILGPNRLDWLNSFTVGKNRLKTNFCQPQN